MRLAVPAGHRAFVTLLTILLLAGLAGCTAFQDRDPTAAAPEEEPAAAELDPTTVDDYAERPIADGPLLLNADIRLRQVTAVPFGSIRLAVHPVDNQLYLLNPTEGLFIVDIEDGNSSRVVAIAELGVEGLPAGMTFHADGTLFLVLNSLPGEPTTRATILRGQGAANEWVWEVVAQTEPYPASGTNFDHLFNGIVVSPDGQWLYVNSGSRTDHGEVQSNNDNFPGLRETALTSKILRVPADAVGLTLPNDEAALEADGFIFARGTRNAYDLAFAGNGDLFAIDNGPDADYSDELNWLREGHHYGFPWRFGTTDNPQQFADYDPDDDVYLSEDFVAVQSGTYANDPDFPPAPQSFTDPVSNRGPAATQFRDREGQAADAAAMGESLETFTAHRSPLGLLFLDTTGLAAKWSGNGEWIGAFILSWGSAGGDLSDTGQDLLHLQLEKQSDNYVMTATQIAAEFKRPIDAVLIENRLYILEWEAGAIWELAFSAEEDT